jgi:hypothetical protein
MRCHPGAEQKLAVTKRSVTGHRGCKIAADPKHNRSVCEFVLDEELRNILGRRGWTTVI